MKQYDAVVIGSGTGGISAALTLATAGKKVLVVEQHNLPGGCSTSFVRGRFEFEAALHEFWEIGKPGHWGMLGKLIMEDYGLDVKWYQVPDLFHCIGNASSGKHYDFTIPCGRQAAIDAMEETFPGSREPMEKFFDLAEECLNAYEYMDGHMDEFKKDGSLKVDSLYYIRKYPNFLLNAERPFNEVLRDFNMPSDAIDFLDNYWGYIGTNGEDCPFVLMAAMIYGYAVYQPAMVEHDTHGLTVAAVEKLRSLGSDVWTNVTATKVRADDNGRICGVETTAGYIPTKYVVANVNPHIAYTKLLDEKIQVPERVIKLANAQKQGVRIFNFYIGLNRSVEELGIDFYACYVRDNYNTVVCYENSKKLHNDAESVAVCYNTVYPGISPEGTTMMTFTTTLTEDVWKDVDEREYTKVKEQIAFEKLRAFEKGTGLSLLPYIEEIEIATPWTFCNYLKTPEGTCYGYSITDWNSMVARMMQLGKDHPVPGFVTCGAHGARTDGFSQTYQNGHDMGKYILKQMAEEEA